MQLNIRKLTLSEAKNRIAAIDSLEDIAFEDLINHWKTAIITLFGFGLTATVFVYQAFEKSNSNEKKSIICALSKTLLLTLCLVVVSLILDFAVSIVTINVVKVILSTLMYAALVYSIICQFDILNSFVIIITNGKKSDRNKDE